MTDSMKFGPEWLRNLSADSCNNGGGGGGTTSLTTPRYQLAEHRYGREEMLILFDRNCKPPESLTNFSTLYIEKTQLPLALIQMTEDETRMWNGGITNVGGQGRGGSVDRGGRGKSGRGSLYSSHYSRGVGFDDSGDGRRIDSMPFPGRNRPFDRSQSERGWSERNGASDPGEWNGSSTSPRKELSRGPGGSSVVEGNWRRHRGAGTEDDDGWRKWGRSSWREGGSMDRDRLDRNEGDGGEEGVTKGGRFEHRGNHRTSHDLSHHPPARTARTWESNHHDINHDNLPEWATENPSESGGSFDASGAFHGGIYSDDDEDGVISAGGTQESRTRRVSEGSAGSTTKPSGKHLSYSSSQGQPLNRGPPSSSGGGGSGSGSGSSTISTVNKDRQKSLHPVDCTKEKLVEKERRSNSPSSTKSAITSITPITPTDSSVTTKTLTSTSLSSSISASASTSALASVSASASASSSTSVSTATSVPALVSALVSASASSPPETVQKRSNATAATVKAKAKTAVTNEAEIGKPMSVDCSGNNKNKSPSKTQTTEEVKVQTEIKLDQSISVAKRQQQIPLQTEPPQKGIVVVHGTGTEETRQKGDDDLDRMKEVADALVAKLMADEESHREKTTASVPPSIGNQPSTVPSTNGQEKWFYRDPQGEVQGPFLASEMAEWCKAGYFNAGLMVRRTCDERYTTLGELMKICGRIPFAPGPPIPPLKLTDQGLPTVSNTVPAALPTLPKTGMEDPILLLQYQHMRLLQNQQLLLMRTSAIAKLSQSEHWATLSPVEQNQLIYQYVIQDSEIPEVPTISTPPFVPHLPSQTSNPVMQLFSQMQQAKLQPDTAHLTSNPHSTTTAHPPTVDPIQQLIQQMGGMQNIPGMQQTNISSTTTPPTQQDNPIKSLLRQLNVNANGHPQTTHMDTVWPQPPPQITPQFNAQNWLAQVGPIPAVPPGQMPTSLWDLHTKEIKTEQQILEEQNLRLQEDRKKEELRKQEELQRQAEEEVEKKKKEEQVRQAEEAKRKDEERKRKEEEKKRKEEEKRKLEEERKKKEEKKRKEEEKKREEKKRKEEEKKREEKRKQEEQNLKKKQEEEKKKKEEMKKQEEKQKKEDEKRKKLEEEQRKQEEDRMRKEANARKQAEAEEQARRAEQRRREAEALRKLQERSKAPWAQAPRAPPPPTPINSFAEIQRLEREKKVEEQRVQQMMQQQLAQQKAIEAAQEASAADSSKRLQFKWAEKATASTKPLQVKSLAQIQQEEQERIAKVKQQERERQEKAGQKESTNVLQTAGIWGTASQCLNWANSSASSGSQAWSNNTGGGTSGFWDDPAPTKATAIAKQPAKQSATVKSPSSNQTLQINKPNKNKNKREEELVKKLFEQNTAKVDDFTQWCNKALSGLQVSVDIPTFVGFLRDIESAYEVKEYVRDYLGDNKQSSEFAKQFLDKRSKWRSAQRPQAQADDLCKPAPAINPNAPTEFQEVKGKSKKPKKGKMYRVDNKILGFSVTAAPDRINVGARDYGEGV